MIFHQTVLYFSWTDLGFFRPDHTRKFITVVSHNDPWINAPAKDAHLQPWISRGLKTLPLLIYIYIYIYIHIYIYIYIYIYICIYIYSIPRLSTVSLYICWIFHVHTQGWVLLCLYHQFLVHLCGKIDCFIGTEFGSDVISYPLVPHKCVSESGQH